MDNLEAVVEECSEGNGRGSDSSHSPRNIANILESRVSRLEQTLNVVYNYARCSTSSEGKLLCPADSCNRSYANVDRFHSHIRESPGVGHKALLPIINQKRCLHCNKDFGRTKDLFHHETSAHNEGYRSRIERLVQYFWEPSSKSNSVIGTHKGRYSFTSK